MADHPGAQPSGPATNGTDPPEAGPVEVGDGTRTDARVPDVVAVRTRDRLTADRHWPGFVSVRGEGCARARVSPPLLDEAIAVIDELFRRSRARGWRISTVQQGSAVTPFEACVVVHEIHGVVSVIERARQVPHQPTPDEQRRLAVGESGTVHQFDRIPTGDLVVCIGPGRAIEIVLPAAQRAAAGGDSLGDRVEHILDAFERRVAAFRPSHPRPIEVAEGLAPPLPAPPGQNPFAADLRAWREARDLRELADAVEAEAHRLGNRSAAVQQWLIDARQRAEQIDPSTALASRR